jgi:fibronectin-binding autotransporter adhesin
MGQVGNLTLDTYIYGASLDITGGGSLEVANSLVVDGGSAIYGSGGITHIDAGGTVSNSGYISGLTGLELDGGGSVTNLGTITGSSGVAIDTTGAGANTISNVGTINGSVNLGNGVNTVTLVTGGVIDGNLYLGTNSGSTLVFDGSGQQSLSQAVTGSIGNPGSLTKQGTGTWIVDEYLDAPVATNVNSGILTVNQTLETGALTVASGATVNGAGNTTIGSRTERWRYVDEQCGRRNPREHCRRGARLAKPTVRGRISVECGGNGD